MSKTNEKVIFVPKAKDLIVESNYSFSLDEETLKDSLKAANVFLLTQIEKNCKYIKSLKSILLWISSCAETINPELASIMLFNGNEEEKTYEFELKLESSIEKYICKSKYFSFTVVLNELANKTLPKHEKVAVQVKLYTSDIVPKQIIYTMKGKPILKGNEIGKLSYNIQENKFQLKIKLQINEVSSHFANGNVSLIVEAFPEVKYSIKPIIVRDLIVKAKEKTCKKFRENA